MTRLESYESFQNIPDQLFKLLRRESFINFRELRCLGKRNPSEQECSHFHPIYDEVSERYLLSFLSGVSMHVFIIYF